VSSDAGHVVLTVAGKQVTIEPGKATHASGRPSP
jgi:hypothetical protein